MERDINHERKMTMALSGELLAKAQAVNTIAVEVADETFSHIGRRLPASGVLTVHCPPYRTARHALVNLSNAALRLWELACVARHEECAGEDGEDGPVPVEPEAPPVEPELIVGQVRGEGDGESIGIGASP